MLDLEDLFDAAYQMKARGLDLRTWAVLPKKSASARVTRHYMKHQRQLQNAKQSGIGEREVARRLRQITTGILRTN